MNFKERIISIKDNTEINSIINDNRKLIKIYLLLLLVCSVIRINVFQESVAIILNLLLIVILKNKFDIKDKKFNIWCYIILLINIVLIYWGYFSSIKLGYADGLIQGQVGTYIYNDTFNYYYESKQMIEIWRTEFANWISGDTINAGAFYGYYNFFVIWNAILRIIFGSSLNLMILIKLQFSIASIFFLYKISIKFLEVKYANMSVVIMNVFPAYLLVNVTLMRDNLVLFFILYASYQIFENQDELNRKVLIKFIIAIMIVTYMRVYIGIALAIALIAYYYIDKVDYGNIKKSKNIKYAGCSLLIIIIIVGLITKKMGYGFLGLDLFLNADSVLPRFDSSKVSSPIKYTFWTLYHIFIGGRGEFDFSGYIGNFLNSTSNIFIMAISLTNVAVITTIKNKMDFKYYKFTLATFIFCLLSGAIVVFTFSSIIPRLYICWFWTQIIVFCGILENIKNNCKNYNRIKYGYIIYLILCILFTLRLL